MRFTSPGPDGSGPVSHWLPAGSCDQVDRLRINASLRCDLSLVRLLLPDQ